MCRGTQVVVDTAVQVIGILGCAASGIGRCRIRNSVEHRCGTGKSRECTRLRHPFTGGPDLVGCDDVIAAGPRSGLILPISSKESLGRRRTCRKKSRVGYQRGLVRRGTYPQPFGSFIKEELVFFDRAADGKAKLVTRVRTLAYALGIVVVRVGRVSGKPVVLPRAAMKTVRSGPGNDIHNTARSAPVLCGEVIGGDSILLNGVERHYLADNIGKRLDIFHAVQQNLRA